VTPFSEFSLQPSGNTDGQHDRQTVMSRCEVERAC